MKRRKERNYLFEATCSWIFAFGIIVFILAILVKFGFIESMDFKIDIIQFVILVFVTAIYYKVNEK